MVQEAELHAEEDNRRREAIALRNDAEAMAFQAEKTLGDYGDRIPSELKAELDGKIQAVREVLNSDPENVDRLRTTHEELVQTLTRVGSSMYEAAGAAGPEGEPGADFGTNGATNGATDGAAGPTDDATVEGEFREVGADR
jgi:molecular chaperone DnaK